MNDSSKPSSTKEYVFMPYDVFITKLVLYSLVGVFCVYAVVANAFILYVKAKLLTKRKRNVHNRRPFDRFPVVSMFIQSLAYSDFFCGLITLPVAITVNFVDVITSDMICKTVRFCNIFFPMVTMNNLFVIGIERYLAVFYPFLVPSSRSIKGLVLGAWIFGGIISLVISTTFSLEIRDIGPTTYTKTCVYNKNVLLYKAMFITSSVVVYFIPSIILTFTSLRLVCFLRRKRKTTPKTSKINSWRFYGTSTFVILIFSFVIPYLIFMVYNAVSTVLKFDFSFTMEIIVRRLSAVFAYSNSAISPTVMLFSMPDLRRAYRRFARRHLRLVRSTRISSNVVRENYQLSNDHNILPTPPVLVPNTEQCNANGTTHPFVINNIHTVQRHIETHM